jgi:hypothetical protein
MRKHQLNTEILIRELEPADMETMREACKEATAWEETYSQVCLWNGSPKESH